jgi:hypothetical protein
MVVVLPVPFTPVTSQTVGPSSAARASEPVDGPERLPELVLEQLEHRVGGRRALLTAAALELLDDLHGRGHAHVGRDERLLEALPRLVGHPAAEQLGDRRPEDVARPGQPQPEPLPCGERLLGRLGRPAAPRPAPRACRGPVGASTGFGRTLVDLLGRELERPRVTPAGGRTARRGVGRTGPDRPRTNSPATTATTSTPSTTTSTRLSVRNSMRALQGRGRGQATLPHRDRPVGSAVAGLGVAVGPPVHGAGVALGAVVAQDRGASRPCRR